MNALTRIRPLTREVHVFGTVEFFQRELHTAREKDARERTAESRLLVENLERKLAEANRAMELEKRHRGN
jgi:hypothetical protein